MLKLMLNLFLSVLLPTLPLFFKLYISTRDRTACSLRETELRALSLSFPEIRITLDTVEEQRGAAQPFKGSLLFDLSLVLDNHLRWSFYHVPILRYCLELVAIGGSLGTKKLKKMIPVNQQSISK